MPMMTTGQKVLVLVTILGQGTALCSSQGEMEEEQPRSLEVSNESLLSRKDALGTDKELDLSLDSAPVGALPLLFMSAQEQVNGSLYWLGRSSEKRHSRFNIPTNKMSAAFRDMWKSGWSFSLGFSRQELSSDLSVGRQLDLHLWMTELEKSWNLHPHWQASVQLGAARAEFGYQNRSYIFKNGPDLSLGWSLEAQYPLKGHFNLEASLNWQRVNFSGDEFENKVGAAQGQPSASTMKTTIGSCELRCIREHRINANTQIWGGAFVRGRQTDVDMEIGWTSNAPEKMYERHRYDGGLRLGQDINRFESFDLKLQAQYAIGGDFQLELKTAF